LGEWGWKDPGSDRLDLKAAVDPERRRAPHHKIRPSRLYRRHARRLENAVLRPDPHAPRLARFDLDVPVDRHRKA